MSKLWNVSVTTTFKPTAPGQHYQATDDLGTYGTREAAQARLDKYIADSFFEKVSDNADSIVYRCDNQEVHLESIYVPE